MTEQYYLTSTVNYMNQQQFTQVLESIPLLNIRKWPDEDIEFLFKVCYHCALRMGEAVKLSKGDFDLERRDLNLHRTKTSMHDSAVIPKDFVIECDNFLDSKADGRLFPGLTIGTVRPWLIKLGKWLDIEAWNTPQKDSGEKTKCHIFRKTKGKDYERAGVDTSIIMGIYRHKSLDTTSNYLRNTNKAIKEVI